MRLEVTGSMGKATAEITALAGLWTLERITTDQRARGMGLGTRLMRSLCEAADASHAKLKLEAICCASKGKGPDQAKLETWYARFGFEATGRKGERGGTVMLRNAARKGA